MSADTGFSTVVVFIILEETSKLKKTKQNKTNALATFVAPF